jgi:hypothetical protein
MYALDDTSGVFKLFKRIFCKPDLIAHVQPVPVIPQPSPNPNPGGDFANPPTKSLDSLLGASSR